MTKTMNPYTRLEGTVRVIEALTFVGAKAQISFPKYTYLFLKNNYVVFFFLAASVARPFLSGNLESSSDFQSEFIHG